MCSQSTYVTLLVLWVNCFNVPGLLTVMLAAVVFEWHFISESLAGSNKITRSGTEAKEADPFRTVSSWCFISTSDRQ